MNVWHKITLLTTVFQSTYIDKLLSSAHNKTLLCGAPVPELSRRFGCTRQRWGWEAFSLSLGSRKPTMMITGRLIIAPLVGLLNPGLESLFPTPLLSVCYGHLILMRCVTCAFGRSLMVGLPQGRTAHPSLKGWTIPWDEVLPRYRGAQIWDLPCDAKWKTSFSNLSRYNICTY